MGDNLDRLRSVTAAWREVKYRRPQQPAWLESADGLVVQPLNDAAWRDHVCQMRMLSAAQERGCTEGMIGWLRRVCERD